ncbi:very long chain fatty acid elongase F-like [Cochliomyia hominivorax]
MLVLKIVSNAITDHLNTVGKDPRTYDIPLCNSYYKIISLMVLYVLLVQKVLPEFMANRKPYDLRNIIQIYNILQFLLNSYIFYGLTRWYLYGPSYDWTCMKYDITYVDDTTVHLRKFGFLYFLSKLLDLMETIFFILRKKFNQVSFLHVYHHTAMLYAPFIYFNWFFGTQFTTIGYVNSLIHVLMYTYYFLSATDTKMNVKLWKQIITTSQILQFFYISVKLFVSIRNNSWCGHQIGFLWVGFIQNAFMTAMFGHFYWRTYIVSERSKKLK